MKHRLPLPRIALGLWLSVASQSGAAADDPSGGALPPTLVTPAMLGAKITEQSWQQSWKSWKSWGHRKSGQEKLRS